MQEVKPKINRFRSILKIKNKDQNLPGAGRYPNLVVPNLHRDSVLG
eukprot:SAG11_NODE_34306_length_272_cov_1.658960_1_plen_45_part_01